MLDWLAIDGERSTVCSLKIVGPSLPTQCGGISATGSRRSCRYPVERQRTPRAQAIQALETGGKTLVTFDDGVVRSIEAEVVEQFKDFFQGGDWNVRRFALAALAGVARNGEAEDAHVVRQWLSSGAL